MRQQTTITLLVKPRIVAVRSDERISLLHPGDGGRGSGKGADASKRNMISFHMPFPLIIVPLILYLKVAGLNGELSVWALEIAVACETPFVSREKHAVIPTTPVQSQQSTHNGITGTLTLPLRATTDETTTESGIESKEKSTLRRSSP